MDKYIVTALGASLLAFMYWFFFGKKDSEVQATDHSTVIVDGGYAPNTIRILRGKPAVITFIRKDTNSCLEEVVFPEYKIQKHLPLNRPVEVVLPPPHPANAGFHCAMNMFHGRIEVAS